jgi:hypothetical protein
MDVVGYSKLLNRVCICVIRVIRGEVLPGRAGGDGIWIGYATRGRDGCSIGDRTGRGGADCTGSLVGDLASSWHGQGVINGYRCRWH